MLKPGFLIQALPVLAIVLAAFVFVLWKTLSRLKPREDDSATKAWLAAAPKDAAATDLQRMAGAFPVVVQSTRGRFEAEAKEISLAGAFIVCDPPLAMGEPLELSLKLARPLELRATVTWNNSNVSKEEIVARGMRVRFLDVSAEARAALIEQPPEQDSQAAD